MKCIISLIGSSTENFTEFDLTEVEYQIIKKIEDKINKNAKTYDPTLEIHRK